MRLRGSGSRQDLGGVSQWIALLAFVLVCSEAVALPMLAAASGSSIYPEDGLFADGVFLRPTRLFSPFSPMTRYVSAKRKAVPFYSFGGKRDGNENFFPSKSGVRAGRSYFSWGGKRSAELVENHQANDQPSHNQEQFPSTGDVV